MDDESGLRRLARQVRLRGRVVAGPAFHGALGGKDLQAPLAQEAGDNRQGDVDFADLIILERGSPAACNAATRTLAHREVTLEGNPADGVINDRFANDKHAASLRLDEL